jgi:hypothetical protein
MDSLAYGAGASQDHEFGLPDTLVLGLVRSLLGFVVCVHVGHAASAGINSVPWTRGALMVSFAAIAKI